MPITDAAAAELAGRLSLSHVLQQLMAGEAHAENQHCAWRGGARTGRHHPPSEIPPSNRRRTP